MSNIILSGYLSKDPESKVTQTGNSMAVFSIPEGKDAETIWYNCVAYGKTGETILEYCRKGRFVTVTGRQTFEIYNGKINVKVSVDSIHLGPSRDEQKAPQAAAAKTPATRKPGPQDDDYDPFGDE